MVFSKWIFCGGIIQDPTCGFLWGASQATLHISVFCVRPLENPEFTLHSLPLVISEFMILQFSVPLNTGSTGNKGADNSLLD